MSEVMADLETVKGEVLQRLQLISPEQVEEVATGIDIEVPESNKTKKEALRNAVLRYLTSETLEDSEDEGAHIYLKLNDDLKSMLEETATEVDGQTSAVDLTKTLPKKEVEGQSSAKDLEIPKLKFTS